MKKTVAVLLAILMVFLLSACKFEKKEKVGKTDDTKITDSAKLGIIPELPVKLGDSPEYVKNMYSEGEEPHEEINEDELGYAFSVTEGNLAVCMSNGCASYYYEKDKIDNGISVIAVIADSAYGFTLDGLTNKSAVKAALPENTVERPAVENEAYFFMSFDPKTVVLSTDCDGKLLRFFFLDEVLIGVSLTDTQFWTD